MSADCLIDPFVFCWCAILEESKKFNNVLFSEKHSSCFDTRDTDFNKVENRLAYMYNCGYSVIISVKECISKFFEQCLEAEKYHYVQNAKICSLSNGPGIDIVGYLLALYKTKQKLNCAPLLKGINLFESWQYMFQRTTSLVYEEYCAKTKSNFNISSENIQLIQGDIFSEISPEAEYCIKDSDILFMVQVFNSCKANTKVVTETLQKIFTLMKPGSIMFYIGSKNNIAKVTTMPSLDDFVNSMYGPLQISIKNVSFTDSVIENIGFKPKQFDKACFMVLQKKYVILDVKEINAPLQTIKKRKRVRRKKKAEFILIQNESTCDISKTDYLEEEDSDESLVMSFTSISEQSGVSDTSKNILCDSVSQFIAPGEVNKTNDFDVKKQLVNLLPSQVTGIEIVCKSSNSSESLSSIQSDVLDVSKNVSCENVVFESVALENMNIANSSDANNLENLLPGHISQTAENSHFFDKKNGQACTADKPVGEMPTHEFQPITENSTNLEILLKTFQNADLENPLEVGEIPERYEENINKISELKNILLNMFTDISNMEAALNKRISTEPATVKKYQPPHKRVNKNDASSSVSTLHQTQTKLVTNIALLKQEISKECKINAGMGSCEHLSKHFKINGDLHKVSVQGADNNIGNMLSTNNNPILIKSTIHNKKEIEAVNKTQQEINKEKTNKIFQNASKSKNHHEEFLETRNKDIFDSTLEKCGTLVTTLEKLVANISMDMYGIKKENSVENCCLKETCTNTRKTHCTCNNYRIQSNCRKCCNCEKVAQNHVWSSCPRSACFKTCNRNIHGCSSKTDNSQNSRPYLILPINDEKISHILNLILKNS